MKKRLNVLLIGALVLVAGALAGCSAAGSGTLPPAWIVKFQDTFNRANTPANTFDLGSASWVVDPGTSTAGSGAFMVVDSGVVFSEHGNGGSGIAGAYTGAVDYSFPTCVTMKFKVEFNGYADSWCGLFINLQPITYAQYFLQVNPGGIQVGEHDGTSVVGTPASAASTFTYDTWYVMQMESNGNAITGRVYDATGTILLAAATYVETSGRTYTTGSVGFYNYTTQSPLPYLEEYVWFDDFTYERYE